MTTAEQDLTPNPDYLDQIAEDSAVTAINQAREAIKAVEHFDTLAHISGVFSDAALKSLREAQAALTAALDHAEEAGWQQTAANRLRQLDREARMEW